MEEDYLLNALEFESMGPISWNGQSFSIDRPLEPAIAASDISNGFPVMGCSNIRPFNACYTTTSPAKQLILDNQINMSNGGYSPLPINPAPAFSIDPGFAERAAKCFGSWCFNGGRYNEQSLDNTSADQSIARALCQFQKELCFRAAPMSRDWFKILRRHEFSEKKTYVRRKINEIR